MKKYKCGRCGKEAPRMGEHCALYLENEIKYIDLCPKCKEELMAWINREKKDGRL